MTARERCSSISTWRLTRSIKRCRITAPWSSSPIAITTCCGALPRCNGDVSENNSLESLVRWRERQFGDLQHVIHGGGVHVRAADQRLFGAQHPVGHAKYQRQTIK